MTETTNQWSDDGRGDGTRITEVSEVIIGRIVDGEATSADRQRFEQMAVLEPSLWRTMALRHEDARTLRDAFRAATRSAVHVDLPAPRFRPTWTLALSGWAAVVLVALAWSALSPAAGSDAPSAARYTPVDHLRAYEEAPFVLGELEPVVVDVEQLSDGRVAVHLIRRIEEVAILDPEGELPVDETGNLTTDPARLRSAEPAVGWPASGDAPAAPRG